MLIRPDDFIVILFGSRTWANDAPIHREVQCLLSRYGKRLLVRL